MGKYQGKHSAAPGAHAKQSAVSGSKHDLSPDRRERAARSAPLQPEAQKLTPPQPQKAREARPPVENKHETKPRTENKHQEKPRTENKREPKPRTENKREPKPRTENKREPKPRTENKRQATPRTENKRQEKPRTENKHEAKPRTQNKHEARPPVENRPKAAVPAEGTPPIRNGSAPKRPRPPKKKRSKRFLFFLLFYVLVLLIGSVYLQHRLWGFLETTQAEMDRNEAEKTAQEARKKAVFQAPQLVFEDWEKGLTTDYWTDLWYEQSPNDLDIREQVYAYMDKRFAPDAVQAYRAAEFTQEAPVYVLKNGEEPLARVTLSGSDLEWEVSDVELLFEGTYSVSVTVPGKCQVRCNDQKLGKEYRQKVESLMSYKLLDDQLEDPVSWYGYSVDGLLLEPKLSVTPPEGYDLLPYGDNGYLLLMEGDNSAYTEQSLRFVKADLEYYMNGARGAGGNMSRVLGMLRRGTQAYEQTRKAYEGVSWSTHYDNIDTSKTYAGDVIYWAKNCFSVDVTYDVDCTLRGTPVDYANATMRVYFLQDGDQYFISNYETL